MLTISRLTSCQLAVHIVLALGQLTNSARSSSRTSPMRYVKQTDEISHSELIDRLTNGKEYSRDYVENLLAKTRSKDAPKAILNQCSVNDLLLIRDHRLFRCTGSYLGKVSEQCVRLSRIELLQKFCSDSLQELKNYCLMNHNDVLEALLKANLFSKAMFDKTKAFWSLVYQATFGKYNAQRTQREHIGDVLNNQSERSRKNILSACKALTRILSKDPVISERDSKYELFEDPEFCAFEFKWANLYQYCKQANELSSQFSE